MSIRSAFVMAVPAGLLVAVAVAAGAHATTTDPQTVALTSGGGVAVAPADATASGTATPGVDSLTGGENWTQLCGRVDKRLTRASAASTRLHAGADTTGSLARLQARLDAATKAGDADRVRVLTDVLAIRTSRAQTVAVKVAKLTDIQQVCKAHSG